MSQTVFDIQSEFCKAMGHPVRLQILHLLRDGPLKVGELVQQIGLSQSAISYQLQILRSARVVNYSRHGTEMVYQLADTRISDVCDLVRKVLVEFSHQHAKIIRE